MSYPAELPIDSALMPPKHQLAWLAPLEDLARFQRPDSTWSQTDAAWVYRYLCNGCGSPATRKSVQGEMLRLGYFMRKTRLKSLKDLTSDDAVSYRQWLASTKSTDEVSTKPVPRLIDDQLNPDWRPFRSIMPLALNAQKTALRLISGCLSFMQDDPSCAVNGNPFRRVAKAAEQAKKSINDIDDDNRLYDKALSPAAMTALFDYIESDSFRGSDRSRIAKHWLVSLLYSTAVRVETLVSLNAENLQPDPNSPGATRLRFRAKHNSLVDQVWTDSLMKGLMAYRHSMDLHWPPLPEEPPYLWIGLCQMSHPRAESLNPTSVWAMLKTLGRQTANWMESLSVHDRLIRSPHWLPRDANDLRALHPHTLRHSWCTVAVNLEGIDLLHAKRHMGHSSITVTERYVANR